jgi:regulatory protein
MPSITRIIPQKRNENRRNIYLDGHFAFGCNVATCARFRLQVGMEISADDLRAIEFGEVKQECFDKAVALLTLRLHSRAELFKKLGRHEWGDGVVDAVIDDLTHMGYVDDARFASQKAESAAKHKLQGRRRAFLELIRSGVNGDVATKAVAEVYGKNDSAAIAKKLCEKNAARLRKLEPHVARRRLAGMLQRRGFDYETVKIAIEDTLGADGEE